MNSSQTKGVIVLDGTSEAASLWNDYVDSSSDASFYHRYEWKRIYESECGHQAFYLAHLDEGRLTGILPLILTNSRIFGRLMCSLPFLNYCGPNARDVDATAQLISEAYALTTNASARYLELRAMKICDESLPVSTDKISLTVPLAPDPNTIWDGFTSKHRNNIRRAYKSNLRVEQGHLDKLDTFYEVMCHSWRALGTPIYKKRFFRSILDAFSDKTGIFIVYQDQTPIAAAFVGYEKGTVEGMWAGGIPKYRRLQGNYVLYWETIKYACESGLTEYHLGRSSVDAGGVAFKKKWGAIARQLYWQYYLPNGGEIPQLNVKNPKYRLAISAWQKLPVWATRIIGPLLARSIP